MNYYTRSIVLFIIFSIIILSLDSLSILNPFHTLSDWIVTPIKSTLWSSKLSVETFFGSWKKVSMIDDMTKELTNLRRQSAESKVQLDALTLENADLRKQLESPLPPSYHFIVASVLGVTQTMDVSVGATSGVKEGMPVVVGTTLVGKVSHVDPNRATIMLLTDGEMHVKAETDKGTKGEVGGMLGPSLKMEAVLQKDVLLQKDLVMTSGTDGFPPDLVIGEVGKIESDDVAVYKMTQLSAFVDPSKLKIVYIVSRT